MSLHLSSDSWGSVTGSRAADRKRLDSSDYGAVTGDVEEKVCRCAEKLKAELNEQNRRIASLEERQMQADILLRATYHTLLGIEAGRSDRSRNSAIHGLRKIIGEQLGTEQVREVISPRPEQALGAEAWAHLGDVGEEPPLPIWIHIILDEPCPAALGLERFGQTIGETHILALIPASLNEKPLTLGCFKELLDQRNGPKITMNEPWYDPNACASSSYWALISKDCVQDSKRKEYNQQKEMIAGFGEHYRLPKIIEMVFGLYLQEKVHQDGLYPGCWTCCEELYARDQPMVVCGFGDAKGGGVSVNGGFADANVGVAVSWVFE
ncbi:MAG: hypothetical protein KDK50_00445 [Chlamydiia bacterium]|nr:hypothetical protein [Chlamydiia bacterium]